LEEGDYCLQENGFIFSPPLATSVACESITYVLNQRPKNMTEVMRAQVTQLATPIVSDPTLWAWYTDWHQEMLVPIALDNRMEECAFFDYSNPDDAYSCEIFAQDIRLLYFPPESSVSRDMCATTPLATITDFGSEKHIPQTVLEGVTMYKDRVYVSVEKIHAWSSVWSVNKVTMNRTIWGCSRVPLGTRISRTILELRSHEVSTLRIPHTSKFYPFNYAVGLQGMSSKMKTKRSTGSHRAGTAQCLARKKY
jgi:hypothetical protein